VKANWMEGTPALTYIAGTAGPAVVTAVVEDDGTSMRTSRRKPTFGVIQTFVPSIRVLANRQVSLTVRVPAGGQRDGLGHEEHRAEREPMNGSTRPIGASSFRRAGK